MDVATTQNPDLLKSALAGLKGIPKTLEAKWFYDDAGSLLFERITELPEYYPTRTELSLLIQNADILETYVPAGQAFIELGSGASKKTRVLLDQFKNIAAYIPTDISGPFLGEVAKGLRRDYPNLTVDPIVSDFSKPIPLPVKYATTPKTAFFPGSTIGNLPGGDAIELLQRVRQWPEITSFIVGADLIKDTDVLINAYDDSQGITAAFNKNILLRLNREIGATFDVSTFRHDARWNSREARIEMHLVSKIAQTLRIGAEEIAFTQGESIHTENSHKYSQESLAEMAAQSGWKVSEFLTDSDKYFAVTVFTPI